MRARTSEQKLSPFCVAASAVGAAARARTASAARQRLAMRMGGVRECKLEGRGQGVWAETEARRPSERVVSRRAPFGLFELERRRRQ